VKVGCVNAAAGRAAYDFLCTRDRPHAWRALPRASSPRRSTRKGCGPPGPALPVATRRSSTSAPVRSRSPCCLYSEGLGVVHGHLAHGPPRRVSDILRPRRYWKRSVSSTVRRSGSLGWCTGPAAAADRRVGLKPARQRRRPVRRRRSTHHSSGRPSRRALGGRGHVSGPWPSDTVFVGFAAANSTASWPCTMTRGHIALKLFGPPPLCQHQCRAAAGKDQCGSRHRV